MYDDNNFNSLLNDSDEKEKGPKASDSKQLSQGHVQSEESKIDDDINPPQNEQQADFNKLSHLLKHILRAKISEIEASKDSQILESNVKDQPERVLQGSQTQQNYHIHDKSLYQSTTSFNSGIFNKFEARQQLCEIHIPDEKPQGFESSHKPLDAQTELNEVLEGFSERARKVLARRMTKDKNNSNKTQGDSESLRVGELLVFTIQETLSDDKEMSYDQDLSDDKEMSYDQDPSAQRTLKEAKLNELGVKILEFLKENNIQGSFSDSFLNVIYNEKYNGNETNQIILPLNKSQYANNYRLLDKRNEENSLLKINKILKENPDDATARLNYGLIHLEQGNPDEALSNLFIAYDQNLRSPKLLLSICLGYIWKNRIEEAIQILKEAIDTNPNILDELFCLIIVLVLKKESIQVIYKSWLYFEKDQLSWHNLAHLFWSEILCRRNESKDAFVIWEAALRNNAQDLDIYSLIGNVILDHGGYDDALLFAQRMLELDSQNDEAYMLWGKILMMKDKPNEALLKFQEAEKLNPNEILVYIYQGEMLLALGEIEKTILKCQRALEIDKENIYIHLIMAQANLTLNRYDDAKYSIDIVLKKDPENMKAVQVKGKILLRENLKDAKKYAEEQLYIMPIDEKNEEDINESILEDLYIQKSNLNSIEAIQNEDSISLSSFKPTEVSSIAFGNEEPNSYYARMLLSKIGIREGDYETAITQIEKAYSGRKKDSEYYHNKGLALVEQGKADEGLAHFEKASRFEPANGNMYLDWGSALLDQGKQAEAISKFKKAIEIWPRDWIAHQVYATTLLNEENYDEAVAYFEKAYSLKPAQFNDFNYNLWGDALLGQGKFNEANSKYEKAIQTYPNKWELHLNYGEALIKQKKYDTAIIQFAKANILKPDHQSQILYRDWGCALFNLGEYGEAISKCKKVIELGSKYPTDYLFCAEIFVKEKNYDAALSYIEKADTIAPNNEDIYTRWGHVLRLKGKQNEAISKFEKILQINPSNSKIAFILGELLATEKNYKDAINYFNRGIDIDPNYEDLRMYKLWGIALLNTNNYTDGIAKFEKAIQINCNEWDSYFNCASALIEKEEYDAAIDYLKKADIIEPNNEAIYNRWGQVLRLKGKKKEAISKFEKVLQINPNNSKAAFVLGYLLTTEGNLNDAINYFNRGIDIDPNYEDVKTYNMWGLALYNKNNYTDAIAKFEKAIQINCNEWSSYFHYAHVLIRKEDYDAAIDYLKKADSLHPRDDILLYSWGLTLQRQGKYLEAISKFQKSCQINPQNGKSIYELGYAFYQLGRLWEAFLAFKTTLKLNRTLEKAEYYQKKCLESSENLRMALNIYCKKKKLKNPYFMP